MLPPSLRTAARPRETPRPCENGSAVGAQHLLALAGTDVLATRVNAATAAAVLRSTPGAFYSPEARAITLRQSPAAVAKGNIAILTAGTGDQPIAEEAAVTPELFNVSVSRVYDVGVAGLHRLLAQREVLSRADVVIVCAGIEGGAPQRGRRAGWGTGDRSAHFGWLRS
jgi:NCAIR mutase (PurE)-related protein